MNAMKIKELFLAYKNKIKLIKRSLHYNNNI